MIGDDILRHGLATTLEQTNLRGCGELRRGKVRDSYTDGKTRTLVVSDRVSAFDRVLGTIPFKGQVLNQLAAFWFEKTSELVENHVIDVPDPNVTRARECTPFPVEMVVRGYLTGVTSTSILTRYNNGERKFGGITLPDGLRDGQKLQRPVITPTTKAEEGAHDQNLSATEIIESGLVSAPDFDELAKSALALFSAGTRWAAQQGLILVDTKYEFGRTAEGRIVVIDEIHTPDSSRYWLADEYQARLDAGQKQKALDKEYVRRWLASQGYTGDGEQPPLTDEVRIEAAKRYIEAFERITGREFVPNVEDPAIRIPRNLEQAGAAVPAG